jgi:hypothetical protein
MKDSDEFATDRLILEPMYLHPDDITELSLVDGVDYILQEDPTVGEGEDDGKWVAHIITGKYEDWVVRFPRVVIDKGELDFNYEVIHHPELPEGYEVVDLHIANYMGELLTCVLLDLQKKEDGLIYFDQATGEQIDI